MSETRSFPWRTLLFVSVAVNLLVIGAVAGAVGAGVRFERNSAEAVVTRIPSMRAFVAALPPEARPEVGRQLGESWRETRDLRRAAGQARRDVFEAVAAEPYDIERVRRALAAMRAADQAVVGVFHDRMADVFAGMTAEQRRDVLERLRRAPPATRETLAPASGEPGAADDAASDERGALRERLRERRREWRERQRQP